EMRISLECGDSSPLWSKSAPSKVRKRADEKSTTTIKRSLHVAGRRSGRDGLPLLRLHVATRIDRWLLSAVDSHYRRHRIAHRDSHPASQSQHHRRGYVCLHRTAALRQ